MTATASAQTATGQITGTVRDSTGAVMAGVKVIVTNQQTGLTRQTKTGEQRRLRHPAASRSASMWSPANRPASRRRSIRTSRSPSIRSSASTSCSTPATSRETVEVQATAVALDSAAPGRPHHHGEAGHGAAAERPQLPAAPVPRHRRRRDHRRAGRDAAGRRQRDQHHRLPADLEQLHDRRHGEHRHGARHAGRGPVGRRDPGVQGTDHDLLGRVRVQLQPDQHGQQDRHERAARHRLRVHPERRARRAGTSSTTRHRRRSWIRSSSGSSSAAP